MRIIDADKLPITTVVVRHRVFKDGRISIANTLAKVVRVKDLEAAPTVDAVPVVRCKECKHWCRNSGIAESPNGHCFHHDIETNGYDFCSYGAKMDGDGNG